MKLLFGLVLSIFSLTALADDLHLDDIEAGQVLEILGPEKGRKVKGLGAGGPNSRTLRLPVGTKICVLKKRIVDMVVNPPVTLIHYGIVFRSFQAPDGKRYRSYHYVPVGHFKHVKKMAITNERCH